MQRRTQRGANHTVRRREFGLGLLAMPALARSTAASEAGVVRIMTQADLSHLPLMVMQHENLVERHAALLGLPTLKVRWPVLDEPGTLIDGLLGGQVDFGVMGMPGLATLWDQSVGTPGEVRALSCVQLQPFMLVTSDAAVKTVADFSERDRIAVPSAILSAQTTCLEMAAAQLWGVERYAKLDHLTLTLRHSEAAERVISRRSPVNSHYSVSPYYYDELATPGVHLVLKSNDTLGGPHANGLLVAAPYFYAGNPIITRAVLAAQQAANAFVQAHPSDAAAIYLTLTRDRRKPDQAEELVADPDITWTIFPRKVMVFADFLRKVGRLHHTPASWKDLFLPELHAGQGS